jgi:DNA-binding IclR family transcriptional regulator
VLAALNGGESMTATQVATATGLAHATISTTLSRLAASGEITKAERGYRLPASRSLESPGEEIVTGDGEISEHAGESA